MTISAIPRLFVAGLGNLPFPNTRHSIGHSVIDGLARRLGIHMSSCRGGFVGNGKVYIGSHTLVDLTLYKSKSLMNISGPSIVQAYRQCLPTTNTSPKSSPFIVLADSLSHRPQAISLKLGGSANGHNGVRSVITAFGGMDFYRLRLGIGSNKEGCVDAADYVMAPLSRQERGWWTGDGLDAVLKEIQQIALKNGERSELGG